jgi:hypothetical protein
MHDEVVPIEALASIGLSSVIADLVAPIRVQIRSSLKNQLAGVRNKTRRCPRKGRFWDTD